MDEDFPVLSFYFEVEINDEAISFQEVTGLKVEIEGATYRHGDSENFHLVHIPGMVSYPPLVCKKGIIEDDEELIDLMEEMIEEKGHYNHDDKFDITVSLMNPEGETVVSWAIEGAYPKSLSTPSLNATTNEIALEEIEFVYDRLTVNAGDS